MSAIPLRYNKKYNRLGPLFEPKVKRVFIDPNYKLKYLIGYVNHNAIHHKYETSFGQWKYDSFNAILSDRITLVSRKEVLDIFKNPQEFLSYHLAFKKQKLEENIDG